MWTTILTVIIAVLKWIIYAWSAAREKSAARKAMKEEAKKMLIEAIKDRDPAKLTAAADRMRRARWIIIIIALLIIGGCGSKPVYFRWPFSTEPPIVLHPITPDHIFSIAKGSQIIQDSNSHTTTQDGWFVSDFYLKEIEQAQVE